MDDHPLIIDGSVGEGGGQIVRTSLSLSLLTGRPVTLHNIRARRSKPGLQRQHLTAVHAAAQLSQASVQGDAVGSSKLTFKPGPVRPGNYEFRIGTAGSTTLVLQTLLPALLVGTEPSRLTLEGGTHNPLAPPYEFLAETYLPLVARMGPQFEIQLDRHGFYPAGGGRMQVTVHPAPELRQLEVLERGELLRRRVRAIVSRLPIHIAQREASAIATLTDWPQEEFQVEELRDSLGPGNVVLIELSFEHLTEVFAGYGQRGVPAERVAEKVSFEAQQYLDSTAAVGEHLADQLLLPLGIAAYQGSGGSRFTTVEPSGHTTTHLELLKNFLGVAIESQSRADGRWEVSVHSA